MAFQFHVPPVNKLSLNQQHAVKLSLDPKECLVITGCPGSGKTTVANFRASSLQKEAKRFKYIIYAKMLEAYVKKSFSHSELNIHEDKVGTFSSWFWKKYKTKVLAGPTKVFPEVVQTCFQRSGKEFAEMVFDETQDLDLNVIKNLPYITSSITICADDAQSVYDDDDGEPNTVEMMKQVLAGKGFEVAEVHLGINYRNPPEIYAFAKAIIPNNPSSNIDEFMKEPGQKPYVQVLQSKIQMYERMYNIINTRRNENIGVLCDRIDQINSISHFLKQKGVEHTAFHSRMAEDEKKEQLANMQNVVVCTNKSAKGLEFQTVIIPFAEEMKTEERYRKSYYVACTRAERSLFLMTSSADKTANLLAQIDKRLYERV